MIRLRRLTDICDINPRFPRDHGLEESTDVSFVPMAAVDEVTGSIVAPQIRSYAEVRRGYTSFKENDVLFAKITPCMENGKAAIAQGLVGGIGFGSTEFHVLRASPEVLPEWLHYFVRRVQFRQEAKRNFTGTAGQQRVPTSFLENSVIPVPSLPEQRRIVDLLSRAEGIVRLRREAQAKAQAIIPALFLDMFGDPTTNPNEWDGSSLGDVAEFQSGGTPSKAREDFWIGDLPWVSPKDMKKTVISRATDNVSRAVLTETNLKLVPKDAILIVVRGMILVHTVPVALASVPLTINQDMKALIPRSGLDATYLLWFLKVSHQKLLGMVSTAAHGTKKLDTDRLETISVPLPPLETQCAFARRVQSLNSVLWLQDASLITAKQTFQSLLSRTFGGDLTSVSVEDVIVA